MSEIREVFKDVPIYSGQKVVGTSFYVQDIAVVERLNDEIDLVVLRVEDKNGRDSLIYSGSILLRRYAEVIKMVAPVWVRLIRKGDFYSLEVYTKGEPERVATGENVAAPPVEKETAPGAAAPVQSGVDPGPDG